MPPCRAHAKQVYPNAIAAHNGVKLVKEWKDKFVRYYDLNPPEETGLKRKLSIENLAASAGAAMQSFRESLSPEKPPADAAAEKATPAKSSPEKETPAKETPAKATPKETPAKATPAKASPKESPASKAVVETPAKATGSTEVAVVPEQKKPKMSMFSLMPCCTARPGRAIATAAA